MLLQGDLVLPMVSTNMGQLVRSAAAWEVRGGSMRGAHTACLHRWITTRVTEYSTERMFERGSAGPDRFACPNCETPFEFVDAARGEGGAAPDLSPSLHACNATGAS